MTEFLPQFRQMAAEAGRDLAAVPVSIFGAAEDLDRLKRHRDQGIARGSWPCPRPRPTKSCRSSIAGRS